MGDEKAWYYGPAMRFWYRYILLGVCVWGALLRILPSVYTDFPLNDGGMFFTLTSELIQNKFVPPIESSYNLSHLPFAYPPLGFFLMAEVSELGRIPLLPVMQYGPGILAALTLIPFWWLARILLGSRGKALVATVAYASLPGVYHTLIIGGGVPRSLGLLFALFSLVAYAASKKRNSGVYTWYAALFLGVAALSHLEMAVFGVTGILVWSVWKKYALTDVARVGIGSLVVSAGWWVWTTARMGWSPWVSAWMNNATTSGNAGLLWLLGFGYEPGVSLIMVAGAVGISYAAWKREWWLPVWLGVLFLVLRRGPETAAGIVMSLAAGYAGWDVLKKWVTGQRWISIAIGTFWLSGYLLMTYALLPSTQGHWFESVSMEDRAAMAWVREHTPPTATFAVVTGYPAEQWSSEAVTEWFPTLTERKNMTTLQSTEWLGGALQDVYDRRTALYGCFYTRTCFETMRTTEFPYDFEYLYLTGQEYCSGNQCWDVGRYEELPELYQGWERLYVKGKVSIWKRTVQE